MKKILSYLLVWIAFDLSHIISFLMFCFDGFYNLYNWFMVKGEQIQTWGGNTSPWK